MSRLRLSKFLGKHVDQLLAVPPFATWRVARTVGTGVLHQPIFYDFRSHGVGLRCDRTELIRTFHLKRPDGERLFELPFSLTRQQVRERLGVPSASGGPSRQLFGDLGPWDRFDSPTLCIHVQHEFKRDGISLVTLMDPSTAPPLKDK